MHRSRADLVAIARGVRLASGLPAAAKWTCHFGTVDLVNTYNDVVAPIVAQTITDHQFGAHVRDVLRCAGIKVSYLIHSYSVMAGVPFNTELSVLGGAFTRLYDDLMDDSDDLTLDGRLTDLFHGRPFVPSTELECLLEQLHNAISSRLARPGDDPIYVALTALHDYQIRSRVQRDPAISRPSLEQITVGKGGLGLVALCALMRPAMIATERDLLMSLGATLQLLDDYVDVELDRQSGRTTLMSRGDSTLADVTDRLRALRPALFAFYGKGAGQFIGGLYFHILTGFAKRQWRPDRVGPRSDRWRRTNSQFLIMTRGADGVLPRVKQQGLSG
jgi:hypothetical protein